MFKKYAFIAILIGAVNGQTPAFAIELLLPAACNLGQDCFFQQYPDMDPTGAAKDPLCGPVTYDGHNGTDLRVISMLDVRRGVPVVAVADGQVLRVRDGEPDRPVANQADRDAINGKECGNGLVIRHAEGFETQYCHLRQGSISVKAEQGIKAGAKIGDIGASGLAEFPHVHLSVRKDSKPIDPVTGRFLADGCLADKSVAKPLFLADVISYTGLETPALMAFGMTGSVPDYASFVTQGPPSAAKADDAATIVWGWFINLRAGDEIGLRITGPDGKLLVNTKSAAVDRNKAAYSAFAGTKRMPLPGAYRLDVSIVRNGATIVEHTKTETVN